MEVTSASGQVSRGGVRLFPDGVSTADTQHATTNAHATSSHLGYGDLAMPAPGRSAPRPAEQHALTRPKLRRVEGVASQDVLVETRQGVRQAGLRCPPATSM